MATKMPIENIDKITKMKEMLEILDLLDISYNDETLNLSDLKKQAKSKLQERSLKDGQYSNGTTGFTVISTAKEHDISKRDKLEEFYSEVSSCLDQMDKNILPVINAFNTDILKVLDERRRRLKKRDYHILVAGESSAGKSSLLNLILGEELLPHHVLNTTSTICEVKYGKTRRIVTHLKHNQNLQEMKLPPRTFHLETMEKPGKSYQEQISPFVHLDQIDREKGLNYEKVEIFWPHDLLEKGVVIIDSPGLGESDDMDKVLMNYLPNAFAFIYVINVTNGGGLQKNEKEKLTKILEEIQSSETGNEENDHLAECSLFICNKWDQVPEAQRDKTKKVVIEKLKGCWPHANLNHQIVYMSIHEAAKAQQYGGVTDEFNNLLQSIRKMILKAINIRLYNHWQWLDSVLFNIYSRTLSYSRTIQLNREEIYERMSYINSRMKKIKQQEQDVRKEIQLRLNSETEYLFKMMFEFIKSSEFEEKFVTWEGSLPQTEETWEETKNNIMQAIDNRFIELLKQWEEENQIYAGIHARLLEYFLKRLNLIEAELEEIEKAMYGCGRQVGDALIDSKSQISMSAKVLLGATMPLWVPVGILGLLIGMPVLGAIAVKTKISDKRKLEDYQEQPYETLALRSKKFLAAIPEEGLFQYARRKMQKTKNMLSKYLNMVPRVIEADTKMMSQLLSESRSKEEVLQQCGPIERKSKELKEKLPRLGLELYPATLDPRDLDWKVDMNSCIGEGDFSIVYRGKIATLHSNSSSAAVKVFEQPFDYPNCRFYLNEEIIIRQLNHKNIVKFYGSMRLSSSSPHKEIKCVFVMELCDANLRSVIFKDDSVTPAKADNTKRAFETFLKWVIQITEGLIYIHEKRLVHRHLKLENILVHKDGRAMISDIGIVGQFTETEKSIIYLAPEVLADLNMRTKEADIYSYGIMLWEMWYGTQAFTELMPLDITTFQKEIASGKRPRIDSTAVLSPEVYLFMKRCWESDLHKRPTAMECKDKFLEISLTVCK